MPVIPHFGERRARPFEGGFRVPAIAWWPGKITAGAVATDMMSHMDWWPTFTRLAGAEPPPTCMEGQRG